MSKLPPLVLPEQPVLVHNDLCPEHWIFDATGQLSGVIDWCDAVWGDPIGDFAGLWIWFGEDVLRRALDVYERDTPPDTVERIRSQSIGLILTWTGEWARWNAKDTINDRAANLIPRFSALLGLT